MILNNIIDIKINLSFENEMGGNKLKSKNKNLQDLIKSPKIYLCHCEYINHVKGQIYAK